ncbi:MAG: TRAP transporter small permease [Clostridia bacterium]|jgi:TRAP-type C4-dicarboxylate transport system permease small subunit|nr:TRAP transporter small permease [Clostridia bacterium]
MKTLAKIYFVFGKLQDVTSITCFILMTIITLISVFMRFVVQIPFPYGEETTRYLMIAGLMIGIGMGIRDNSHQGVESIVLRIPEKPRNIVLAGINWLMTLTYAALAVFSAQFAFIVQGYGQHSPAIGLPMSALYYLMMVGFIISVIENIVLFYRIFIEKSIKFNEGEEAGVL